jgi:hypothetical protein
VLIFARGFWFKFLSDPNVNETSIIAPNSLQEKQTLNTQPSLSAAEAILITVPSSIVIIHFLAIR